MLSNLDQCEKITASSISWVPVLKKKIQSGSTRLFFQLRRDKQDCQDRAVIDRNA
jgi:hypothetical protein